MISVASLSFRRLGCEVRSSASEVPGHLAAEPGNPGNPENPAMPCWDVYWATLGCADSQPGKHTKSDMEHGPVEK